MTLDPATARRFASRCNHWGITRAEGSPGIARLCYQAASYFDPEWSVPYFNRGLLEKEEFNWEASRWLNQRAAELNPDDQAAWWNLGIAATALADWNEARRAWRQFGIHIPDGPSEITMPPQNACVRLQSGEVIWGTRLDPARVEILNVPTPESERRYRDIVLNDGAPDGVRHAHGIEYPVFNEIMLWKASEYSTYSVSVTIPSETARNALLHLCAQREMGVEDWSTLRNLCALCSQGDPGEHACANQSGASSFGFAALSEDQLQMTLQEWASQFPDATFREITVALPAESQDED